MDDQTSIIPPAPLYQRLKAAGVDLTWYDKALAKRGKKRPDELTPLHTENCCKLSIYFLKKNGELWTTTYTGEPHMVARDNHKTTEQNEYTCLSCNKSFESYTDANAHLNQEDK